MLDSAEEAGMKSYVMFNSDLWHMNISEKSYIHHLCEDTGCSLDDN